MQHVLLYFAVFCHILGGGVLKPEEKEKPAKQTCLAGGADIFYRLNHMEKDNKTKRASYPSTGGISRTNVTFALEKKLSL